VIQEENLRIINGSPTRWPAGKGKVETDLLNDFDSGREWEVIKLRASYPAHLPLKKIETRRTECQRGCSAGFVEHLPRPFFLLL